MSRLLRPAPFEPQPCECKPGHTLRWLCGITEECARLSRHCNGSKPHPIRRCPPADRRRAHKARNVETETS